MNYKNAYQLFKNLTIDTKSITQFLINTEKFDKHYNNIICKLDVKQFFNNTKSIKKVTCFLKENNIYYNYFYMVSINKESFYTLMFTTQFDGFISKIQETKRYIINEINYINVDNYVFKFINIKY